ncbi:hypothetical protein LTR10_020409 [Elasticomyces elasticus]|uniref:EF-hand domain-containing protein n=1 Tax=Exophiala sideris TaxID=1016849 RepID=A0ABR0JLF6_9EURO|nr:hypothetical protein LTR10_020409 [Elasticomyces elasticus]KAK5036409.1 hypothetical protein LTS07_002136 [Exophiala sideris]KAK5041759.1 hypothetical protein LTR13_002426 [Exophiala sideris]KAK5066793.1 hypothetical protein LTR69_002140 [Exophiala sideris]KAK5184851.1 hypothetical protein LTR44_002697 [Eurotiomycetes sp. CCFEE 6388]
MARKPLLAVGTACATLSAAHALVEQGTVILAKYRWFATTLTTTLTAPSDPVNGQETWTCRASHVTTTLPPPVTTLTVPTSVTKRALDSPTTREAPERPNVSPQPTVPARFSYKAVDYPLLEERDALADKIQLFEDVSNGLQSNGTSVVSKEQYLGFFNAEADIGGEYGQNVLAKFAMHDLNGDGVLTFEETQMTCDRDGFH